MNKTKYLDKIYKKQIANQGIFKKVIMVCPNAQYSIILNKVLDIDLISDYVAPLIEYYDEGYLIKPVTKFSLKHFVSDVDVLIFNALMTISEIYESTNNQNFDFGFNYNSIIILPKGFVRLTKLEVGNKIKFKTLLHID